MMDCSSADRIVGADKALLLSRAEFDIEVQIHMGVLPFKLNSDVGIRFFFGDHEHINAIDFIVFLNFEGFASLSVVSSPDDCGVGNTFSVFGWFSSFITLAMV
jgi:hypothetical protein